MLKKLITYTDYDGRERKENFYFYLNKAELMELDKKYGGIISFCDCLGKPSAALEWDMKLWWPQTEAIIANRMAYEIFGEAGYLEASEQLIDYTFTRFEDKEYGEWYGYLHYDSTPSTTLKGNLFKGPFHLPRMLILMNEIENGRMLHFFA